MSRHFVYYKFDYIFNMDKKILKHYYDDIA